MVAESTGQSLITRSFEMYKLYSDRYANGVMRQNEDGSVTTFLLDNPDPANTDYQAYLKFLEEGGQPLPADDNGQTAE